MLLSSFLSLFSKEQLAAIPEFMDLGPLFKSSEPVQLTEAETEYFVRCIKHVFTNHIVFQVREVPPSAPMVAPCAQGRVLIPLQFMILAASY